MKKYPCVYMRGGTSKAVFFHKKDLPADRAQWPELFMKVMGTPDVKQIDGMGGTVSSTSKVAVISPSAKPDADVDYDFFQVGIGAPQVDDASNCGNISSAVGPFAIDEGLVPAREPETVVRVFNTNTKKLIEERVLVKGGRAMTEGDAAISGVPGTGSPIRMLFHNPGGSKTGRLFPTGRRSETVDIPGRGRAEVTVIDCANPVVFVEAQTLGLSGNELTELNANRAVMEHIEAIRGAVAVKLGFVASPEEAAASSAAIPKIVFISASQSYTDVGANLVSAEETDFCCRAISLGSVHKAYPMTVAVATAAAARLKGTVVNRVAGLSETSGPVRIGHASGTLEAELELDGERVVSCALIRTARRIMDGFVYAR
ncbi:MAG TPA: PrpF domain-containing protein [Clostridia bacterium]|nr:PrpF domain-containing protein [Clostridia bacterium]